MQLDIEILQAAERHTRKLSSFVREFLMYARGFDEGDFLGRIDFLVHKGVLELHGPQGGLDDPVYFICLAKHVPDDMPGLTDLVLRIHGYKKSP